MGRAFLNDIPNNQTTKRKAPFGQAVLTRTTRKDKHRKYRTISEMRNALKLNQ
jgi:hypothetical protein